MNRRDALKLGIGAAMGSAVGTIGLDPTAAAAQQRSNPVFQELSADALAKAFMSPPDSARPRVWWHWMNGNITWDGAKNDMDWMKRSGIAGLQKIDAGTDATQVVDERLLYMTPEWKDVFRKVADYAATKGLELGIDSSPGWSETGGPWVQPADAMKKMSWSVLRIQGGQPFAGALPKPPTTTGIFQTSGVGSRGPQAGKKPADLYADQKVLALRLPADATLPTPTLTASGGVVNAEALSDGDLDSIAMELPAAAETGGISWIQYDYGHQVTVRGLTFSTPLSGRGYNGLDTSGTDGAPPTRFRLESSDDGQTWRNTGAKIQTGAIERTISVDSVRARYFRFVSVKQSPAPPRPVGRWGRPAAPPPTSIPIRQLVLRGEATVHSFEEKAGFSPNNGYYKLPSGTAGTEAAVKTSDVIDLTTRRVVECLGGREVFRYQKRIERVV